MKHKLLVAMLVAGILMLCFTPEMNPDNVPYPVKNDTTVKHIKPLPNEKQVNPL